MPLPLFLLTGFLGSGKTTLLARLIRSAAFGNTAVIINEFGAVGLDHVLVSKGEESRAVLLDSGCLCCALDDSLQTTLERLFYDRERGVIPNFERVVVETSGLADPAPIVNTLVADRLIARHYALTDIIVTIDAVLGPHQLDSHEDAAVQLAVADRVILTKTDLATPGQTAVVRHRIRAANPRAKMLDSVRGEIPPEQVLGARPAGEPRQASPAGAAARSGEPTGPRHEHHQEHDHIADHGIGSRVIRCKGEVSWPRYAAWVRHLQMRLGDRLLRMKGILAMGGGRPHAVHGVHHMFSPPEELAPGVPVELIGTIVLVTRNVSDDEFAACETKLHRDLSDVS